MALIYKVCRVVGCKITSTFFFNASQTDGYPAQPIRCFHAAIPFEQTLPGFGNPTNWALMERYIVGNPKYCRWKTIQPPFMNPSQKCTIKRYYNIGGLMGEPKRYRTEREFEQPIPAAGSTLTSGPLQNIGVTVGTMLTDASVATTVPVVFTVVTSLTFYVKFMRQKLQDF